MAKVIEFYLPENSRAPFLRAAQPPTGEGYSVRFGGKEVSPEATGRRRPWVAAGANRVRSCCRY